MRRLRERDRGSVIILTSVLLVVLVGMCAFAVDVGHIYNVRRQSQSAVDTAALAGGAELTKFIETQSNRRAAAAAWVKANSYMSAEVTPGTPEEWNLAWSNCTDPGHLPITSPASIGLSEPLWPAAGPSQCISFSENMRTIRVKLPTQTIDTAFGGVFGVGEMSTGAVAEVELSPGDQGGILPFAVYLGAGALTGPSMCMATASNMPTGYPYSVCSERNTSGNFGTLNISVWGDANMPKDCSGGVSGGDERLKANIAEGIDHMVLPYQDGHPNLYDMEECEFDRRTPNHLQTRTGNQFAVLPPGLINGTSYNGNFYEGRLTRGQGPFRKVYNSSPNIDDTPLWDYVDPEIRYPDVPATCDARTFDEDWTPESTPEITGYSTLDWFYGTSSPVGKNGQFSFTPGPDSRAHMEQCMTDFEAATAGGKDQPPLFTDALAGSPRLGWLPVFDGMPPSGSSEYKKVVDFQAIFINTLFGDCNPKGCAQVWEPGEDTSDNRRVNTSMPTSNSLAAVGAYRFETEMLPISVQDTNPTYGGGFDGVQLSR